MVSGEPSGQEPSPTLNQLEEHLGLALIARDQLASQSTICQAQVKVSMEAFGLALPSHMPLRSFTQYPTRTNFDQFKDAVTVKAQTLEQTFLQELKAAFNHTVAQIGMLVSGQSVSTDTALNELKGKKGYLDGLDVLVEEAKLSTYVYAKTLLSQLEVTLDQWRATNELGQDLLTQGQITSSAERLCEPVTEALQSHLLNATPEQAEPLQEALMAFVTALTLASYSEPVNLWSAEGLVRATLASHEKPAGVRACRYRFDGPLSFDWVDRATAAQTPQVQVALKSIRCIESYLRAVWRMETIRVDAVNHSLQLCQTAYLLKTLLEK